MSRYLSWLKVLLVWFGLLLATPATAQNEDPLLTVFLSGKTIEQASELLLQAIGNHNYTFVRQQSIDSRLVPAGMETRSVRIIYFCNFDLMSQALALDTRTAEFLPCRITLLETGKGVALMAVNPVWVSNRMGNFRLHEHCKKVKQDYLEIMKEAAL